jgi:hypothetical protein
MTMAEEDRALTSRGLRTTTAEMTLVWFLRVVAVYCLFFGILYWIRLIGLYPGPLWRFDLMPVDWQVAAATLAVLFPFAAVGLWILASWGPVIWFFCAVIESTMYAGFPALFGQRYPIVAAHLLVALIYIVLRAVIYFQSRKPA